mmetsp:Transcript_124576/g.346900  ORF Transcript_124576/g.346900 Transcript_124576/m.346900 type:complete len:495 (-) Transcript_124576:106-1590(-)|eukprot:CAMPEP_0179050976 /NCGR_PEP_ID=MMETSP0796-20121207/21010_1 /TAXON_ID=73915 /ORGANISM="Pyrodinium bahamense, Strain pbaha01" /LENGTH=494 /DNA_ID=CAMNT_0020747509 /DNA_START=61 /DNA_END=1545 /DNA_ORIENTATION=-
MARVGRRVRLRHQNCGDRPLIRQVHAPALAIFSLVAVFGLPRRPAVAFFVPRTTGTSVAHNPAEQRVPGRGSGLKLTEPKVKEKVKVDHVGQKLRGWVKSVGTSESGAAFVNVGRGRPAMLLPDDMDGVVVPGQVLEVWVKQIAGDGHVLLTMHQPRKEVQSLRVGDFLHGKVTHVDESFGGIFLDVGAQKDGLLLAGQMTTEFNATLTGPIEAGFEMGAWVKDVREDDTFALTMFEPKRPLEEMAAGERLQGTVKKIPSFGGAFVDVGAEKYGWLPQHELAGGFLADAPEPGQEVEVWVKEVSRESGLQLTLQQPRLSFHSLKVGFKLRGTVTGIPRFGGAFVDVGAVKDGLLHAADMEEGAGALEVGQNIVVWVKQKRGDWSLQLTAKKPRVSWSDLRLGQQVRGKITHFNNFGGVFVDIGFVNDALLRQEEMSGELSSGKPSEVMEIGQEMDLWIKALHRDAKIDLTMHEKQARDAAASVPEALYARRGIV